jgi:hypothetical protein
MCIYLKRVRTNIGEGHTYRDVHMLGAQLDIQGEEGNATT